MWIHFQCLCSKGAIIGVSRWGSVGLAYTYTTVYYVYTTLVGELYTVHSLASSSSSKVRGLTPGVARDYLDYLR